MIINIKGAPTDLESKIKSDAFIIAYYDNVGEEVNVKFYDSGEGGDINVNKAINICFSLLRYTCEGLTVSKKENCTALANQMIFHMRAILRLFEIEYHLEDSSPQRD